MPTKFIPFADFAPDLARSDQGLGYAESTLRVIPKADYYVSAPNFASVGLTGTIAARVQGAAGISHKGTDYYFAGTDAKLYDASTAWTDRSGATYTTASTGAWEFVVFGDSIIACNGRGADNPQYKTIGAAANFANLTAAFKASHVGVVRDFVVFGDTNDATDGDKENRVRWSAFGDETDYTVSPVTQSDYNDLPTGGAVQKILGGEYGIIICQSAIYRMTYSGPPTVFRFDEVKTGIGTDYPNAAIKIGEVIFFISTEGFSRIGMDGIYERIGVNTVDETFFKEVGASVKDRVYAAYDAEQQHVYWFWKRASGNYFQWVYSIPDKRWSQIANGNFNMELGVSLQRRVGYFGTGHALSFYDYSAYQTGCFTLIGWRPLADGRRCLVTRARPVITNSSGVHLTEAQVTCEARPQMNAPAVTASSSVAGSDGSCPLRIEGRFFRFTLDSNLQSGYTTFHGLEIEYQDAGTR